MHQKMNLRKDLDWWVVNAEARRSESIATSRWEFTRPSEMDDTQVKKIALPIMGLKYFKISANGNPIIYEDCSDGRICFDAKAWRDGVLKVMYPSPLVGSMFKGATCVYFFFTGMMLLVSGLYSSVNSKIQG